MSKLETIGDYLEHPAFTPSLWKELNRLVEDRNKLLLQVDEHNSNPTSNKVKLKRTPYDYFNGVGMIPEAPFLSEDEKDYITHKWVSHFIQIAEKKSDLSSNLRQFTIFLFQKVFQEVRKANKPKTDVPKKRVTKKKTTNEETTNNKTS